MKKTNQDFLTILSDSFREFLISGTSRSTAKLKPLHGAIAKDLAERLGKEFTICSQGYGDDKEAEIEGRYVDKKVDITVKKDGNAIAGIAVKFVMQNYSQNSNNYFENMLGETANIRCKNYPYFQVFIILDKIPYYNKDKQITRWETFTDHNISKYLTLGQDNTNIYYHTPDKTLIYVVHIPDNDKVKTMDDYLNFYKNNGFTMNLTSHPYSEFGNSVILNNYELFMEKVYHTILSK